MANQDLFERLELKYLVDESSAQAIRRAIRPYCEADPYNGQMGAGYPIRSLYLDSPTLFCFRAKERGDHDRFKLRARVYDAHGDVSLEIKRKRGDVIWKERARLPRAGWAEAAQGFGSSLMEKSVRNPHAVERFARLVAALGAEPKVLIDYEREAYASRLDGYARVTFDRRIVYRSISDWDLDLDQRSMLPVRTAHTANMGHAVVLELKCEQFMPAWLLEIIHDFQLNRIGFSKYNTAMRDELMWSRARDMAFEESDYA
jgi:hypothetical protein